MSQNTRDGILAAIGNTPLIPLSRISASLPQPILAKAEYLNPTGSIKDRMAIHLIEKAEQAGLLGPHSTIVESTSGNTGASLAMVCAIRGYRTILVCPDKVSDEKIRLLEMFGAKVVITPTDRPSTSPESYYATARRIAAETPGAFFVDQLAHPDNIEAHYVSTGPEIWEQTNGQVDCVIIGAGTGGTVSGVGRYLKERNPDILVVAVEPVGSVFHDWFKEQRMTQPATYLVEGIGDDILPETLDFSVIDDILQVSDAECFQMARRLVAEEGIFVGGSSGGAVSAALRFVESRGTLSTVVTLLPDSGFRYMSKSFSDTWMRAHGLTF
ncbi:MAG TPA: cysteine synthase family protein [Pyrinomonadaceae bacterium]|nr:cysteine synthase family protein [Pyrinomonadaceae bacterium]